MALAGGHAEERDEAGGGEGEGGEEVDLETGESGGSVGKINMEGKTESRQNQLSISNKRSRDVANGQRGGGQNNKWNGLKGR